MAKISKLPRSYRNAPSQLARDTMFKKLWSISSRIALALKDSRKDEFEAAVTDLTSFYVHQSDSMRSFLSTPDEAPTPTVKETAHA
jgi:hypothetical protein